MRRAAVVTLIIVGLLLLAFPTLYRTWAARPAAKPAPTANTQGAYGPIRIDRQLFLAANAPKPVRILIPSLSIDLPVIEAPVVSGYWETSETTASHGVGSAGPGQKGNMVIFAHARPGLFLPLKEIQKQAAVYVFTDSSWYAYRVTDIREVAPQDVTVIGPTPDETLTLFTCTGFLDSKRLVVIAKAVL